MLILDRASSKAAIGNHHAVRHADQFPVAQHHARTLAAVIQRHIHACGDEFGVERVRRLAHGLAAVITDGADHGSERRDRIRPDHALGIVILFDAGPEDAGDADAVAAHFQRLRFTLVVEECRAHRGRIFGAQIKHMPHLDAAADRQHALAVRAGIARLHIADVGHFGLRQIAPPVDAGVVEIHRIGADDEVAHIRHGTVGNHAHGMHSANRPKVARRRAKRGHNLGLGRHAGAGQTGELAHLDLVDRMIAAHQQQHDGCGLPGLVAIHCEHDRLEGLLQGNAQQRRDILAFGRARRGRLLQRLRRCRARGDQRQSFGLLDVRGKVGTLAVGNGIFAGIGNDVKLMAEGAADRPRIRRHGAELEAETLKDAHIGIEHDAVADLRRLEIAIEGIRVLHREFTRAHHTKSRTTLIAKLGLDVIEIERQLTPAPHLATHQIGHDFLGSGLDHKVAVMAVFDAQQFGAELIQPPRLLPKLGRLHHGHEQLDGARAIHFLAHDGLHLADAAQAQRQIAIEPRCMFFDHARAQH